MGFRQACWDLDDDPRGNVQHIEQSRSSGLFIAFGETSTGRLIAVIYEEIDDESAYPVTAYEVD
jgi:hypothetical protein